MMILCMAREGMANKEIAAALGISLASVKRLIHSLLKKLKARDRTHAVITAIRLSIISVESENNDDHI
jgi:DNA-binding NarL/FixJ family response regulator